ncbi:MAG: MBOAT family protein [Prevotellaceae bacterium]|jgi:D-alanyl-lipoteichoic acid acyltransferase DltB (MBOAT superfamily)|nr:MBOAT family protein [Prevotellaceae bacterium]
MDTLEFLEHLFAYNEDSAITFTRLAFWIFFAALLVGYQLVYRKLSVARSLYLLLFSIFFYYKSSGMYFALLLFSTVLDFNLAHAIHRSSSERKRKLLLAASVTVNLGLLAYFKYAYFITGIVNSALGTDFHVVNVFSAAVNMLAGNEKFELDKLILPIGISFYTFQILSYTIDVYRRQLKPLSSLIDFGFYVSFFPSLVAGPIVRASDFVPQIHKDYSLTRREMWLAAWLIVGGLVKKMVVSDYISLNFVDRIFDDPLLYSGFELLMGVYGYAIQIYCDFSGYTDVALGVALLLGFRLPPNFNSPYKAASVRDFWQRWHISLSRWLRDYLYIPLGGNRHGKLRTYLNLMLTMLLGGLWHGASGKFVVWGGLHGLALVAGRLANTLKANTRLASWRMPRALGVLLTFHFVCLAWTFFRAANLAAALDILHRIGSEFYVSIIPDVVAGYGSVFALMGLAYLLHVLPQRLKVGYREAFLRLPDAVKMLLIAIAIFCIYQVASSELQPFIYFQF